MGVATVTRLSGGQCAWTGTQRVDVFGIQVLGLPGLGFTKTQATCTLQRWGLGLGMEVSGLRLMVARIFAYDAEAVGVPWTSVSDPLLYGSILGRKMVQALGRGVQCHSELPSAPIKA